jgi:hypothetical protein
MALSADEAERIFGELAATMREYHLEWIVAQVEAQISLGRVALKSLEVNEHEMFADEDTMFTSRPRRSRRKRATFAVSEQYSPQEKLELLIDGLSAGVIQVNQIADEVASFRLNETPQLTSIRFVPEAEVKEESSLSVTDVSSRKEAWTRLEQLLRELRNEVSDADQTSTAF